MESSIQARYSQYYTAPTSSLTLQVTVIPCQVTDISFLFTENNSDALTEVFQLTQAGLTFGAYDLTDTSAQVCNYDKNFQVTSTYDSKLSGVLDEYNMEFPTSQDFTLQTTTEANMIDTYTIEIKGYYEFFETATSVTMTQISDTITLTLVIEAC
jgi:hypothetical protein